jgi:hypothetical protein
MTTGGRPEDDGPWFCGASRHRSWRAGQKAGYTARPRRPARQAEPKTLRYRILHAAGRLARSGRRRRLKISATWPWAQAITAAWDRITAVPQAP